MAYFPRMLDKIRLHARGELAPDYVPNLGKTRAADGMCCNFLRVRFDELRERVLQGGTDEEILDWCFDKGRPLNEGDLMVWNGFTLKLGWNDFASAHFAEIKKQQGLEDRHDIDCIPKLIDHEEGRLQ
ncbi:MAG: DUF5069 domain-containing protein [Verrucomicrobiota bacterium]|nr:DUF5069 domain-containing protein [Verrucomicrobiota bacterium]